MAELTRSAVSRFTLVSVPDDGGSLRADLMALAERWTVPLDREERAVAGLIGAARHEEALREGLDAALIRPLGRAVTEIGTRADSRGEPVDADRLSLLGSVLQAFWWQRYTAAGDGAMSPMQVESLVDDVLMPIVAPLEAARAQPAGV